MIPAGLTSEQVTALMKLRPAWSFEEFKEHISPDTKYTKETYAAFQLYRESVPAEVIREGVGAVFEAPSAWRRESKPVLPRGYKLRVTAIFSNYVYAVPDTYVENFWETVDIPTPA